MNIEYRLIAKASALYGILAVGFSIIGIFLPERAYLDNPLLGGFNLPHVAGHIVWGLMAGLATLRLRYFLLTGAFAIIIDSDHLLQFFNVDAIGRMSHSIPFGIFSSVIMMIVFGKKDYLLGGVVLAAMLTHISFDTFTGSGNFPLFVPFYDHFIRFQNADWIFFQLGAVIILGLIAMQSKRQASKKSGA